MRRGTIELVVACSVAWLLAGCDVGNPDLDDPGEPRGDRPGYAGEPDSIADMAFADHIGDTGFVGPATDAGTTNDTPILSSEIEARHVEFFDALELDDYALAEGCETIGVCLLVADFNGDGIDDVARLVRYTGTNRFSSRKIDLLIVYSVNAGPTPSHEIFGYVGDVGDDGRSIVHLELQPIGEMEYVPGRFLDLAYPAINIKMAEQTHMFFPTFRWYESREEFSIIDKSLE